MGERFDFKKHGASPWPKFLETESQFPGSRVGILDCKEGYVAFGPEVPESGVLIEVSIDEIRTKVDTKYYDCDPDDILVLVGFDLKRKEPHFEIFIRDCTDTFFRTMEGELRWFRVQEA